MDPWALENTESAAAAPVAESRPRSLNRHGTQRIDEYAWLEDLNDPAVTAYLESENAYSEQYFRSLSGLRAELVQEMRGRIPDEECSAPIWSHGYYYYVRTGVERDYAVHCRRKGSLQAPEEIVLDENQLALDLEYFDLGDLAIAPDNQRMAYTIDTSGEEHYDLFVVELTGSEAPRRVASHVSEDLEWAGDSDQLFFLGLDSLARPWRLMRVRPFSKSGPDILFTESDQACFLSLWKSRSQHYLFLDSDSNTSSEVRYWRADRPTTELSLFHAREPNLEYSVDHQGDRFLIVTNDQARNFRLMGTAIEQTQRRHWGELFRPPEETSLEYVEPFARHLVLGLRQAGLDRLEIWNLTTGSRRNLEFPEPVYSIDINGNVEYELSNLRVQYTSWITPETDYEFDLDSGDRRVVWRKRVEGGFDPTRYEELRVMIESRNGVNVPVTLLRLAGREKSGEGLYLMGYGAYEEINEIEFDADLLSLVDRGITVAQAHVRGGGELGRAWYESGKLLEKENSFTDFIACANGLIAQGYAKPGQLVAHGASAGGLLVATCVNRCPDYFAGIVAEVPFVDVVSTLLDESLPLTVSDWEEFGDPTDETVFRYQLTYSPYDNIRNQAYPAMLVTTSIHDSRVPYWEAVKWVARLRARRTDSNPLLLQVEMAAGHHGVSGLLAGLADTARIYAFVLSTLGRLEATSLRQ